MIFATLIVTVFLLYAGIGVVFGAFFAWRGVNLVDPAATKGTWGFRVLIVPGSAALWPMLLGRWIRAGRGPKQAPAENAGGRA